MWLTRAVKCHCSRRHQSVRAARLQNETAPKEMLDRHENWFEQREKGSEQRSETCPINFEPLSRRFKISHRHFSKSFHRPQFAPKHIFFTARLCRGSHANSVCFSFAPTTCNSRYCILCLEPLLFSVWKLHRIWQEFYQEAARSPQTQFTSFSQTITLQHLVYGQLIWGA